MLPPRQGWRSVNHCGSNRHLATDTCSEVAAPRCGRIVLSTIEANWKREHWPRERVGLAWLDALMDQLHGAHDNGRPANTPAQTRNLAEHQAAQINAMKNTTDAVVDKGQTQAGTEVFATLLGSRNTQEQGALPPPRPAAAFCRNPAGPGPGNATVARPSILQSNNQTRKETA
jgi:hypothetical protein